MNTKINVKAVLVAVSMSAAVLPSISMAASAPGTTKQYVSDAALTTKVKTALLAEKNLHSLDITVTTQNGIVQLSGFVTSSVQQDQAVEVAKAVEGVKGVKNDLHLKSDKS